MTFIEKTLEEFGEKFGSGNGLFRTSEAYFFGRDFLRQALLSQQALFEQCVPENRTGIDFEPLKGDWNDGFNACRNEILNKMKEI